MKLPTPIYQTDRATLYCADALQVLPLLPAGSVDLVLCDPPYGITQCDWDKTLDVAAMWTGINHCTKRNAAQIIMAMQPFACDLITANRKHFRYEIIWEKTSPAGFLNARRMPLRIHELLLMFYRRLPTYNPQKLPGEPYVRKDFRHYHAGQYGKMMGGIFKSNGGRFPTTIWKVSNHNGALWGFTQGRTKHPTQKPVELMELAIKTYSNEGDLVLDFCMGSGTTGVAAAQQGRRFIGVELNREYAELAAERIKAAEATP